MSVGSRLDRAIRLSGLSLAQLAELSGIDAERIRTATLWGRGVLKPRELDLVAELLGASYEWIQHGTVSGRASRMIDEARSACRDRLDRPPMPFDDWCELKDLLETLPD